jgi:MFS family permease
MSRPARFIAALLNRNFRYLWLSFTCASFAQRMDGVVLGWLVLELTDSAFFVGLIGALRFGGALLGPLTGVVADRCDRRRLLIVSLLLLSSIVLVLCALVALRRLEVWHLFVGTTLWGVLWAIHQPAQQSLQADVLGGRLLVNGISLTNTAMNAASIAGPAFAGVLLACCGATTGNTAAATAMPGVLWSYLILLGLHLLQLLFYALVRLEHRPVAVIRTSIWQNVLAGLRYSCGDPGLWTPLVLAGMVNMVAFPLQFGLLPIFAREVFSVGAAGLGLLGAAIGIGSFAGSLLMAALGTLPYAGRWMLIGTTLWLGLLIVFALTPVYHVALGVLVLLGIAQTISLTNMSILLLGLASGEMRGRVMGLRSLAVAPLFPGGVLAGAAAGSIGVPITTLLCGVIGLVIVVCVAPWVPWRSARQE